jgi:hypothetical protein
MTVSLAVFAVSAALFFFYVQTVCQKALRREFSRPYFRDVLDAVRLEFPRLCEDTASNRPLGFKEIRLALRCDFVMLEYLLKHADPARRPLPGQERMLLLYFRWLLFFLPVRHVFRVREKEAVAKLAGILQHLANILGERLSVSELQNNSSSAW